MPRQVTRDIHEHEILISFNDDADAVRFDKWWGDAGFELFGEWIDEGEPS